MTARRIAVIVMIIAAGLVLSQCGADKETTKSPTTPSGATEDTIPPAAILDLVARAPTVTTASLVFVAPGDDGSVGTAASYDVRYHGEAITGDNWDDATLFDGEPSPQPGGQLETIKVGGLAPNTIYFFALKTTDDEGNISGLSNSPSVTTLQELTPPADVADLEAVAVNDAECLLTWTAPGDDGNDGTASQYEIRYAFQPISSETWASASVVSTPPTPRPGGEPESLLVSGMRPMLSYYFALKAADEVPNWSGISNLAYAMGYSVNLELSSQHVQVGDQLMIRFRAPGGTPVSIFLNQWGVMGCDPSHPWVKDSIVSRVNYAEGVHEVYYDFQTSPGNYLPAATYYVVLCWDFDFTTAGMVMLEEPTDAGY